jgi:hypothetical protein
LIVEDNFLDVGFFGFLNGRPLSAQFPSNYLFIGDAKNIGEKLNELIPEELCKFNS